MIFGKSVINLIMNKQIESLKQKFNKEFNQLINENE